MTQPGSRPRFSPSPCDTKVQLFPPLISTTENDKWFPILSCPADFPLELFESAVDQLIHHPEYNSTLILRSETVSDTPCTGNDSSGFLKGLCSVHNIRRRLLPRRPGRDASLEQNCTLYASTSGEFAGIPSTLVLTPILAPGDSLPYYHPAVRYLAFRYIPSTPAIIRIEAVVLPDTPTDLNSRLYRTSLALLDTLHRYGWGALTKYQKRVKHDCVIAREEYQDLYLIVRERHKHLVGEWKEVTDPLKHVYEDIGIATYLMLLWKKSFGASEDNPGASDPPWKHWPRPPGGFLDLGCGNGLLTHILVSEGYEGHGIDLRARTSWEHYSEATRAALHVLALDPTQYTLNEPNNHVPYLKPRTFLIGNHADELTPWLPVIATLEHASGYLSIPCCAWSFDERFSRSSSAKFSDSSLGSVVDAEFIEGLNLGSEGGHQSQYSMYRIWLASLSQWLGWKIECDTLRIPSTRNWAIIGRERLSEGEKTYTARALDIIQDVVQRGAFKTRKPEGKAGGH
ncbi:hypothetical protein HYDPIDRAFT_175865 [Hydnomerulius pinastri MD-312]|uniref:tRNA (uracil-O(2)-)-methyltransferase n=1 Tax=Hydnomerulius pinastri MD-312 TaxID=994086 RepID=A0A0C9WEE1_9AGAM|nr:hypothetical protein HYDPIDRAFT_175865 [Hydnomerulius pinastri MD-312]